MALLAKQGWRIIMNPESLLAQVYKARHFPNGSFLNATLGTRRSATWRSIWMARTYLERGLRYRVGNGNRISIWADPWIPEDGNFKVITPRPFHSGFPYAVSDFIDPISRSWNFELLSTHLWEVDRQRVLSISIGGETAQDRLIWHYSKTGSFTVKSCYHMIISSDYGESSNLGVGGGQSGSTSINWDLIWRLKVPPKVHMFLWRATLDILPHYAELCRRRIRSTPTCDRCNIAEETTNHVLFGCCGRDEVWTAPPFSISFEDGRESFWSRLNYLKTHLDGETFLLATVVLWKTWENRNREIFEPSFQAPGNLVQWCAGFYEQYQKAQLPPSIAPFLSGMSVWQAPSPGIVKVNVDVGLPRGLPNAWVAMVARNEFSECLWWSKKSVVGRPSSVDVEALAILHGLQVARAHGWWKVLVESDCLQLVSLLASSSRSLASFGAILDTCLEFPIYFETLAFAFIRRSGNILAYRLATALVIPDSEGPYLPPVLANDYE